MSSRRVPLVSSVNFACAAACCASARSRVARAASTTARATSCLLPSSATRACCFSASTTLARALVHFRARGVDLLDARAVQRFVQARALQRDVRFGCDRRACVRRVEREQQVAALTAAPSATESWRIGSLSSAGTPMRSHSRLPQHLLGLALPAAAEAARSTTQASEARRREVGHAPDVNPALPPPVCHRDAPPGKPPWPSHSAGVNAVLLVFAHGLQRSGAAMECAGAGVQQGAGLGGIPAAGGSRRMRFFERT
jgi:hypothetical protein